MTHELETLSGDYRNPEVKRAFPKRNMVPIGPTETIRKRLDLSGEAFGEAIGYARSAYYTFTKDGQLPKTAALAAECLQRRQQASGEAADEVFILRVIKGAPTAVRVSELRRMKLDDIEYFLVPVRD